MTDLNRIARALAAPGKGILAADESTGTIEKRFKSVGAACTEETRRSYRELLFRTPDLDQAISGVILFDETVRQRTGEGIPMPELLRERGIIPGIKVDRGARALAQFAGETITEGLDGLRDRLAEYGKLGAQFTKWRAVIKMGDGLPTPFCLEANAQALARFAALSQEAGLVPIVEPEVLMEGDHTMERCAEATEAALRLVFHALSAHRVRFEGMLLKPNMVVPGMGNARQAASPEVAAATLCCLRRFVPAAVPGIMFLSGGMSDVAATQHLDAMNRIGGSPWELSFSFGRALQAPALKAWAGRAENGQQAQSALRHRALCNHAARFGHYNQAMEGKEGLP